MKKIERKRMRYQGQVLVSICYDVATATSLDFDTHEIAGTVKGRARRSDIYAYNMSYLARTKPPIDLVLQEQFCGESWRVSAAIDEQFILNILLESESIAADSIESLLAKFEAKWSDFLEQETIEYRAYLARHGALTGQLAGLPLEKDGAFRLCRLVDDVRARLRDELGLQPETYKFQDMRPLFSVSAPDGRVESAHNDVERALERDALGLERHRRQNFQNQIIYSNGRSFLVLRREPGGDEPNLLVEILRSFHARWFSCQSLIWAIQNESGEIRRAYVEGTAGDAKALEAPWERIEMFVRRARMTATEVGVEVMNADVVAKNPSFASCIRFMIDSFSLMQQLATLDRQAESLNMALSDINSRKLQMIGRRQEAQTRVLGIIFAVNTLGAIALLLPGFFSTDVALIWPLDDVRLYSIGLIVVTVLIYFLSMLAGWWNTRRTGGSGRRLSVTRSGG
jgi:hypothetical protein